MESLATAFDFGAGVFDRLTAAVGSGDAAGWAGRGLAEAQQDFARLPPLAHVDAVIEQYRRDIAAIEESHPAGDRDPHIQDLLDWETSELGVVEQAKALSSRQD